MPGPQSPPRAALRTASKTACFIALALAPAGCANLQPIGEDQCGNRVVEEHEDCDGESDCGLPGTATACRIVCDPAAVGTPCDRPGYRCGTDGVCRRPSGDLAVMASLTTSTALDVFSGDTNLDGCHELFLTTRQAVQISAFASREPGRCPAATQSLPFGQAPEPAITRSAPFLADLTGDGRPDLARPGAAQFGDSLFVHIAGATPELSPILYPTLAARERARPLTVRFAGNDALLLFLDDPPGRGGPGGGGPGGDAVTVGVAGVLQAQHVPINLGVGLMGDLKDLVILATGELEELPQGAPAGDERGEVLAGFAGGSLIYEIRPRPGKDMNDNVTMVADPPQPVIGLPPDAPIRQRNAAIALLDEDLDGHLDVVVNTEAGVFIAYGTGKGTFHSTSPPDLAQPDGKASPFLGGPPGLGGADMVFVAGDFDPASPGLEIEALPCGPSAPLESAACGPIEGGCEAAVVDIDRDGVPDIVSTENQQPGLVVRRSVGSRGFQVSFVDTRCPVHDLAAGDFDDDGVGDVAFFDQIPASVGKGEADKPFTTLMIAYGNAYAAPSLPEESGRFEHAEGLAAGRYVGGGPGTKLYAARGIEEGELQAGFALVEGYGERHLFAPFYLPAEPGNTEMESLTRVDMPAAVGGRFSAGDATHGARPAVALMTLDHPEGSPVIGGSERLWLLDGREGGGLLQATSQGGEAPLACAQCVLLAIDVLPAGKEKDGVDELLFLGGTDAVLYSVSTKEMAGVTSRFFEESGAFKTSRAFASVDGAAMPPKHAPRPLVADVDGDGWADVVLRAQDGSLAVLWGTEGADFVEGELIAAGACLGRCSAALLDVDGDGPRELIAVLPGAEGEAGAVKAYHVTSSRALEEAALPDEVTALAPPSDTDFTAVVAADLDGDGVDDLAIMNGASLLTALRALPVTE